MSAHAAPVSRGRERPLAAALSRVSPDVWLALGIAVAVGAMALGATGGLETLGPGGTGLVPNITLQIALTLGAGAVLALACAVSTMGRARVWGLGAAVALFVLAGYTALSISWSVDPASSWLEASRTLAYAATFAGAIALVRLMAGHWRGVLLGVLLAAIAVSLYALSTDVFPAAVAVDQEYARISAPFGYWNAVGLTAALGVAPCLWLGARREGHGVVAALATPALCVLAVTLMLSYSRGALAVAVIGAAFWFAFVPLRLRALATVAVAAVATAAVVAWAYRQPALTSNYQALAPRAHAGHRLGLVLLVALALSFAAALAVRFAAERHPLSPARRRAVGIALAVAVALVPVAGIGALAASSRGLSGTIAHEWNELTNPKAATASSGPNRLASAGNDHALYWKYAVDVFDRSPVVGAGAGSYPIADERFLTTSALSTQAHSYVFQTLADLGIVGLALSLVVAAAWMVAAVRATGLRRPRAPGSDAAERIGLVTLAAVVLTFTLHSAIDWTWFVPADAVLALLCAGWVAGRGRHEEPLPAPRRPSLAGLRRTPVAAGTAAVAICFALLIAWTQWEPLRSEDASNAGAIALENANNAFAAHETARADANLAVARADARTAIARDPLDITPLALLGNVYAAEGRTALAQTAFDREVALQPSNSQSWWDLASYEQGIDPSAAYADYATAYYLDPQDTVLRQELLADAAAAEGRT